MLIRSFIRLRPCFIAVFSLFIILGASYSSAESKLVITTGKKDPFSQADGKGLYQVLVRDIFSRLGIEAKTVALPSERSLLIANSGTNDGNIARIEGLEKKYPNLVRVPESLIVYDFMAFTLDTDIAVDGWKSLAPYNIGFITGWKIFEKNVTQSRSVTKVRNPVQLFTLLKNGRADIVLIDRWGGLWWANRLKMKIRLLEPPIESREMYLYMHKKHKLLIPKLVDVIKEMKQSGELQGVKDRVLNPLIDSGT